MTALAEDYWGNSDSAFGMTASAVAGSSVIGSQGKFSTEASGTVSFLFKTPEKFSGFVSLFNQGNWGDDYPFEVGINGDILRLTTSVGGSKFNSTHGVLFPDTWYYFCMRWDTALATDNLTWYFGALGEKLDSGSFLIGEAGDPSRSIFIGGRSSGNVFSGGFFQSIAIYDRTLSDKAIQAQFDAAVLD